MLNLRTLKITPEILNLIAQIDEFKGLWGGLEQHTTSLQLLGDVANYGQKFTTILGPLQNQNLNQNIIKSLHQSLLTPEERANMVVQSGVGQYKHRNLPLVIQRGEKIIGTLDTAAPEDVEGLLQKLIEWVQTNMDDPDIHPLMIVAIFSFVFMQICPFETGNQRLMRLLINLLMLKSGYSYAPYVSLEPVFNGRIDFYFEILWSTQTSVEEGSPDWNPWLTFFFEILLLQTRKLKQRLESKETELSDLPALSGKIMKLFKEHKRLQMNEIEKMTKGKRATLKLRLGELVDAGYLKRHGKARSTWYSLV